MGCDVVIARKGKVSWKPLQTTKLAYSPTSKAKTRSRSSTRRRNFWRTWLCQSQMRSSMSGPPNKWSVAELVAHFAEAEVVNTWRYRQMIEHDGCPLPGYDQEVWHKLGDYGSRRPEDSLMSFRLLREANLQMFARLTPEEWQRKGIHAERGPTTVRDLVVLIAGHDLNHLEQTRKILGE